MTEKERVAVRSVRRACLIVGLLVPLALAGCSTAAQAKAGEAAISADSINRDNLTMVTFEIPSGKVTVEVGPPVEEAVLSYDGRDNTVEAPRGGSLVPLNVEFYAGFGRTGSEAAPLPVDVAFVSDGRTYPVPTPYQVVDGKIDSSGSDRPMYLPIQGQGAAASLTLTYDGLTQSYQMSTGLRDAGAAQPWYEKRSAVSSKCPTADWSGDLAPAVDGNCSFVAAYRVPYFADLGWAPPGHTWLTLAADVNPVLEEPLESASDGREPYTVDLQSFALTVNGAKPVGGAGTSGPPIYDPVVRQKGYQVFDVVSGPAVLEITANVAVQYLPRVEGEDTTSEAGAIVLTGEFDVP